MKTNQNEQIESNLTSRPNLAERCAATCRKLIAEFKNTKQVILADFRGMLGTHDQVLRLALNEAEALAWETDFPYLVFPVLAMEKAQAVAAWETRQRVIQGTYSRRALTA